MDIGSFTRQFKFNPEKAGLVGVERETFLASGDGRIAPLAMQVLPLLSNPTRFGYELSACQLEDRTPPTPFGNLLGELTYNDSRIEEVLRPLDLSRVFYEVGPEDMPLDIFPDPTGRYATIAQSLSMEILLAACRVIGTHVHVGMPNPQTAVRVYNGVLPHRSTLSFLGDGSHGERLRLYAMMAGTPPPRSYRDWADFHQEAQRRGFESDPRKNWDIIRISVHGTIEFRMFGTTNDRKKVVGWAERCLRLCESFLLTETVHS